MMRRYAAMQDHFAASMYKEGSFKLTYAASRDMHSVMRFCVPVAAELAALHREDYAKPDSPLAKVVKAYSYCFTEKDDNWVAMLGAARAFADPELAEASHVFLTMLGIVQLNYMLFMPYMAECMGEVWPNKAEEMLSGITRAVLLGPKDRHKLIKAMTDHGIMPATAGMSDLLGDVSDKLFWKSLKRLIDTGEVTADAQ